MYFCSHIGVITGLISCQKAAENPNQIIAKQEKNKQSITREYQLENGEVIHLIQTNIVDFDDISDDIQEILRASTKQVKPIYESVEGVSYSAKEEENHLTEIIEIDFTKENIDQVKSLDLISVYEKDGVMSREHTLEMLEKEGWEIIE